MTAPPVPGSSVGIANQAVSAKRTTSCWPDISITGGVGKAVFYHVGALKKDDDIQVIGDDNQQYPFKVEWVRKIDMTKTGADGIRQIVGKTADERLTLITCGGDFDSVTGEYKERIVVRAIPVQ